MLASNSETCSERIASNVFEARASWARCLDVSTRHGLRDVDPNNVGSKITLEYVAFEFQNLVQVWVGGTFELPVIETGARGAEEWLEPKWHQFTTAPKRVSITYEQSRPPLR